MMTVKIHLTASARRKIKAMKGIPPTLLNEIKKSHNTTNQILLGRIITKRLSIPRTSPPTLEGLRVQTNTLRKSMHATAAVIVQKNVVESAVGSPVKYARVHEFGGALPVRSFTRKVNTSFTRQSIMRRGKMKVVRLSKSSGGVVNVRAHIRHVPARRFVWRELEAMKDEYKKSIRDAMLRTLAEYEKEGGK